MIEEWRDVVGYEDFYIISNFGIIKRYRGSKKNKCEKIIFQTTTPTGYKRTVLQKNGTVKNHFVHRLVAEAFIGPRPEKFQVNHINKIRGDNSSENLEYVSCQQNKIHSMLGKKRGVRFRNGKYESCIWINNSHVTLIKTVCEKEAYETYKNTYKEWFGFYPW